MIKSEILKFQNGIAFLRWIWFPSSNKIVYRVLNEYYSYVYNNWFYNIISLAVSCPFSSCPLSLYIFIIHILFLYSRSSFSIKSKKKKNGQMFISCALIVVGVAVVVRTNCPKLSSMPVSYWKRCTTHCVLLLYRPIINVCMENIKQKIVNMKQKTTTNDSKNCS